MDAANRETRKGLRRRGKNSRTVDLDDLVLELPPKQALRTPSREDIAQKALQHSITTTQASKSKSDYRRGNVEEQFLLENHATVPELALPELVSQAEQRIIEQHRKIVEERLSQRQRQLELTSQRKTNRSPGQLVKGNQIKHAQPIRKLAVMKSQSIRIKYNRVPSNKMKLIYIDVISQMVKDYIREKQNIDKFIESVNKAEDAEKKKGKRGKKKKKDQQHEHELSVIKRQCQNVIKEYYDRVNEYFSSVIDLQLSNALIRNDLARINAEKNALRMDIFKIRQKRSQVGLQMKQTRNEIRNLTAEYSCKELLYKQLLDLKQDDVISSTGSSLIDQINYKLDRKEEHDTQDGNILLDMLKQVNQLLEHRSKQN
jgi:hypothetical protein